MGVVGRGVAKVVCVGIGVLDRTYEVERLPSGPGKFPAHAYRESGGGMSATAAAAVAALGGEAAWIGRLGEDEPGEAMRAALEGAGVDASGAISARGAQTPSSAVIIDATGERMLAVFRGAGLPDDVSTVEGKLAGAGAALADARWLAGARRLFELARARGVPGVLDADNVGAENLHTLAPLASHVVFSEAGLAQFSGIAGAPEGLRLAAGRLGAVLGVTLGERGSLWWRDGRALTLPAPSVAARDTNGCGDVFHGAYALAIAEGSDVMAAARFATAAAALKAARGGGWNGLPDRTAVEALLREGWQ